MTRREVLRLMGYAAPAMLALDMSRAARALAWSCAPHPGHPGQGHGYGHHCGPGHGYGHHQGGPDDEHRRGRSRP